MTDLEAIRAVWTWATDPLRAPETDEEPWAPQPSGSSTFGLLERWGDRYTRTLIVVLVALLAVAYLVRRTNRG